VKASSRTVRMGSDGMADTEASVAVVATHTPMAFLLYLTKFVIEIDGTEHEGKWGQRTVAVAPGQHTVRMWFRYLGRKCGAAEVSINATPDATHSISYRAPLLVTSAGKASVQS
jgi:hypothetical protein